MVDLGTTIDPDLDATPGGWMRPLGRTGLTVSAVTLGAAPLGSMPENFGHPVEEDDAVALVDQVLHSPIRTIDTANGYSGGASERRIGLGIARAGGLPDDVLVVTKVDARDGDYSGVRVRASVRESQERLGIDRLPLVHLHDPEFHDLDAMTAPGGAVDTLVALRDEGVVEHIGLAGGDVHVMRRYLDLGVFEVLLVHNRLTLVDRSAESLVARAAETDVAVVNAAVFGGGILAAPRSGRTDYGYRPAPPATRAAITAMADVCDRYGTDLATAALAASVREPAVASTIVGFSRPERIATTVDAATTDLPDDLWAELAALRPAPEHWLDAR
ncbi:aldo/keto reductase [Curtobacterium sp. MCBD17_035]|uniref:aldo/keto reductase n=1 Tax=Curtobacterium sp. MCBD17_035 TaxID=2175673 RepID=UPI0015E88DC2|nr:aldo/keto reductase [Curtobacterium sp. MCBD17_035]WIB68315.1 aldo/keto reductase [Curtobacterium sp. MCBD17_035]